MTTLHCLVTISELSAGFNLINTGVLNCLIMCQNARNMHHSEVKKIQKLFQGASPDPFPIGEGTTPNSTTPLYSRSTWPPKQKSWICQCTQNVL